VLLLAAQPPATLDRAAAAFTRRDFGTAEQVCLEVIQREPKRVQAHKLLGMVYAAQERFADAEAPFRRACELDAREENACYYLGRTLYALSRFQESRAALETALRHRKDRGRPLHSLALALEALGDAEQAEKRYREAIRAGEAKARVDYGLFLVKHGRGEEGLRVLREAGATAEAERIAKVLAVSRAPRQAAAPPVHFEPHELPVVVRNGASGRKYVIESMIAGVAVFDYDNDGWPDIYFTNGAETPRLRKTDASYYNRLLRNLGNGHFQDVTTRAGVGGRGFSMGVATADYDNDGCADLFVTGVNSNTLYHNRCDGTFEDVTEHAGLRGDGTWAVGAGWFDYDNDGWLDLFLVRYMFWDPATEPYCGGREPGHRTYCHPRHYEPLPNALYQNQGDGTFRDVSMKTGIGRHVGKGMGLAFGDANQDGLLDIVVSNDTMPNFLFQNLGGGRFEEIALRAGVAYNADGREVSAMGIDFRDYDNDGREDFFIPALSNETFSLYRSLGGGRFMDISGPAGISAASLPMGGWSNGFFDFNNDGWKDIFTSNSHVQDNVELTSSRESRQANSVFINEGGRFRMELIPGESFHRGAAFGDLDRDGRIDVAVSRLNEKALWLRNVSTGHGHWVALRLRGEKSNRDGIGALVRIETAAGAQWNRMTTAVGYACSSEPVVHFGLGTENLVKVLEIDWPSGTRTRLENLPADRRLVINESTAP
jgi:Tfp pilus assembly protein PilF